jgi:hypothetical protein
MNFQKRLILFPIIVLFGVFHFSQTTSAATYDIGAGLDYDTLTDAMADPTVTTGDILNVQSQYVPGDETFVLAIDEDVTIDCGDTETIGTSSVQQEIRLDTSGITIENCIFEEITFQIYATATNATINSNTVDSTNGPTRIEIVGDNATISDNIGLHKINIDNVDGTTISGNTIELKFAQGGNGVQAFNANSSSATVITNNTFNYTSTDSDTYNFIRLDTVVGTGTEISDNLFYYEVSPPDIGDAVINYMGGGTDVEISGNYIILPTGMINDNFTAIDVYSYYGAITNALVQNNTIVGASGSNPKAISIHDGSNGDYDISVTIKYNLLYSEDVMDRSAIEAGRDNVGDTITITEDYNGHYNFNDAVNVSGEPVTINGTLYTNAEINSLSNSVAATNPGLVNDGDANVEKSDYYPYEASCYYDVNRTTDIGAHSGDRTRTEVFVDYLGTPNFTTLDFNTINEGLNATCAAVPTVNVAAGTYAEEITATGKSGITMKGTDGSGSTTINASGNSYGISLSNVDSSTIQGFTINGATIADLYVSGDSDSNIFTDLILSGVSSVANTYSATRHPYTYDNGTGSHDYNANGVYFAHDDVAGDPNASLIWSATTDDFEISAGVASTPQTWNLALVNQDSGAAYFTMYTSDTERLDSNTALFDSASALETYLNSLGGPFVVECWLDDAYIWNGSSYDYTAPTGCANADPTLSPGYQASPATPAVSKTSSGSLYIANSDSNEITSSTISSNAVGVSFVGAAASNTIGTGMTLTSNTLDLSTSSTSDNTITDCTALTYLIASTGGLTNCQTKPSATLSEPTQTSGENTIDFSFTASDPDNENLKAKVEYEQVPGGACTGPWLKANLSTTVTATSGTPTVDNSASYQITNISTSGENTISGVWIANELIVDGSGVDGDHCLQITVNDETADQATPSSEAFYYAYQAPTPPVETGGSSIGAFLSGIASNAAADAPADSPEEPTDDEPADEEPTDEEPVVEEADEPAEEELPVSTVSDAAVEVYEYFVEPAPAVEAPVEETPEESTEDESVEEPTGISQEDLDSAIDNYEYGPAQETYEEVLDLSPSNAAKSISGTTGLFVDNEPVTIGGETFESQEELEEYIEEELAEGGAYWGALDINDNGISDAMEAQIGVFGSQDEDLAAKVVCGAVGAEGFGEFNPAIPDGVTMGNSPGFIICSDTKGEFEVGLISLESYDEIKESEEEVNLEDNLIYLGTGEIVEQTAIFTPQEGVEIPEDEYYLLVIADEIKEVMTVKISDSPGLEPLSLELSKEKEVGQAVGFIKEMMTAEQWRQLAPGKTIELGTSAPGIMYLTYNSKVVHSTVISDASEPLEITVNVPKTLAFNEDHKLTAYIYNPGTNTISNISSLIFRY